MRVAAHDTMKTLWFALNCFWYNPGPACLEMCEFLTRSNMFDVKCVLSKFAERNGVSEQFSDFGSVHLQVIEELSFFVAQLSQEVLFILS